MLVGNKIDQCGDRMIMLEEGQRRSREIGCVGFREISVRESIDQVNNMTITRTIPSKLKHFSGPIHYRCGQYSTKYPKCISYSSNVRSYDIR